MCDATQYNWEELKATCHPDSGLLVKKMRRDPLITAVGQSFKYVFLCRECRKPVWCFWTNAAGCMTSTTSFIPTKITHEELGDA